jgi:hypothetical protein
MLLWPSKSAWARLKFWECSNEIVSVVYQAEPDFMGRAIAMIQKYFQLIARPISAPVTSFLYIPD